MILQEIKEEYLPVKV